VIQLKYNLGGAELALTSKAQSEALEKGNLFKSFMCFTKDDESDQKFSC
jgi:hypothetical protein